MDRVCFVVRQVNFCAEDVVSNLQSGQSFVCLSKTLTLHSLHSAQLKVNLSMLRVPQIGVFVVRLLPFLVEIVHICIQFFKYLVYFLL